MTELIAPLPRVTLSNGMTIAFEAIDPTTGAAVANVKVSQVAIYGNVPSGEVEEVELVSVSLPDTTPLWAFTPTEPV
jgi:hypothetical protein